MYNSLHIVIPNDLWGEEKYIISTLFIEVWTNVYLTSVSNSIKLLSEFTASLPFKQNEPFLMSD